MKHEDWMGPEIELPCPNIPLEKIDLTPRKPMPAYTKEWCICRRSLLKKGEAACWCCQSEDASRKKFMADAMTLITRAEALDALRGLADCDDHESAHGAAEMLLLRFLGDEELAAAFYAVPK